MVSAAEIRKKVRQAEQERIRARSAVAVEVAQAHERVAEATATLRTAETEFRRAVKAATSTQGYTVAELAQVTDVGAAALRASQPEERSGAGEGNHPEPWVEGESRD